MNCMNYHSTLYLASLQSKKRMNFLAVSEVRKNYVNFILRRLLLSCRNLESRIEIDKYVAKWSIKIFDVAKFVCLCILDCIRTGFAWFPTSIRCLSLFKCTGITMYSIYCCMCTDEEQLLQYFCTCSVVLFYGIQT